MIQLETALIESLHKCTHNNSCGVVYKALLHTEPGSCSLDALLEYSTYLVWQQHSKLPGTVLHAVGIKFAVKAMQKEKLNWLDCTDYVAALL